VTSLDNAPTGAIRVISMCAGQGRDVFGALHGHRRASDVAARLVELDPTNVAAALAAAPPNVEVVEGDAGVSDAYTGAGPAHVVVACGIFGNISHGDVRRTVGLLPMLCASGATVVWTRHPADGTLLPMIDAWFVEEGFARVFLQAGNGYGVGAHRLEGPPASFAPGTRFFTFADG
jgi:hypothetical protein